MPRPMRDLIIRTSALRRGAPSGPPRPCVPQKLSSQTQNGARSHRLARRRYLCVPPSEPGERESVFLRRQDLAALVHAGLQVDVVRPLQLARVLVIDVGVLG